MLPVSLRGDKAKFPGRPDLALVDTVTTVLARIEDEGGSGCDGVGWGVTHVY